MNNSIFFFFYGLAHQNKIIDNIVIFFAVYFPYLVIMLAGIFLLFHHEIFSAEHPFQALKQKWKEILLVFFSGCLAWAIDAILKLLIHSPRPFDVFFQVHPLFMESDFSFPSGHATFFMAMAVSIFFSHKKAGYVFMFFALLIGIARIIAGVHFPSDVLVGFILGGIVSSLVAYFMKNV